MYARALSHKSHLPNESTPAFPPFTTQYRLVRNPKTPFNSVNYYTYPSRSTPNEQLRRHLLHIYGAVGVLTDDNSVPVSGRTRLEIDEPFNSILLRAFNVNVCRQDREQRLIFH